MRASRKVKVLFTGNLDREIYTNPFFEAKAEKFYLRAQIARIQQATTLTTKGRFKEVEDSENREIEEDVPEEGPVIAIPTGQMKNLVNWVHFKKNLLKNGTLVVKMPQQAEEEEPWTEEQEKEM